MTKEEAKTELIRVKRVICMYDLPSEAFEALDMAIEALQTESEWIPCSERLPSAEREGQVRGFYLITNERGQVSVKAFEFTDGYVEYGWNSDFEILAWMPLPKPYGERREP